MRSSYWVLGIGYWVISSLLVDGRVAAQDIHYSQFYSSPLTLNPALTGAFEGQYRFVGNERRQWGSITLPYVYETFGLSAEMKQPFKALPDFAAGLAVYRDKAGDSEFGTLQINLSGAYSIRMNSDSTQFLTIGLQSGMTQRKINYNKLTSSGTVTNMMARWTVTRLLTASNASTPISILAFHIGVNLVNAMRFFLEQVGSILPSPHSRFTAIT